MATEEAPKTVDVVVPAATPAQTRPTKPEKPNDAKFKAEKEQAQKELNDAQEKLNAIKAQLNEISPRRDGPQTETQKRQSALKKELSEIRNQQANSKGNSTKIREEKTALEAELKTKIAEQKKRKDAMQYKSLNELNSAIEKLERQVETGQMRLVDERKALDTISRWKKQRRNFDEIDAGQKKIDDIRAAIEEKKKILDDPEVKRLGTRYSEIQAELDELRLKQEDAYKTLNAIRDEKTKLQAIQQEKFLALRKLGDDFSREKRLYKKWEDEANKIKRERYRQAKEAEERERRKKVAEEKLEEASAPAFEEEINLCETLIAYFDPTAPEVQAHKNKAPLLSSDAKLRLEESKLRTVDDSGLKGVKLSKKEDREEEFFMGGSGGKKKGKKGGNKASAAATPEAPAKFNVSAAVFEQCGQAKVKVPDSQAAVPETLAQLRELLTKYRRDQKQQTEANIAAAKKEIARLEAEADAAAAKTAPATPKEAASPAPIEA